MKKLSDAPVWREATITTADATPVALLTIPTTSDTSILVKMFLSAVHTTGGAWAALAAFTAAFNNDGGVLSRVRYISELYDEADAAYDVEIEDSGTNILVNVTGKAATGIRWKTKTLIVVT